MADVIVVGGGPAGSAAALRLAREGFGVAVVEQARFPRTKVCGEYLSPAAVRELRELGVAQQLEHASAPIAGVRIFNSGARVELPLRAPGWSLPRATLDDTLLNAARKAGARVINARAEDLRTGGGKIVISLRTASGEEQLLEGRAIIGADGAHSLVARRCGLSASPRNVRRFALGGHYDGFSGLDGYVEMFVDGASYFAVNPFSSSTANVMLVVPEHELQRRRRDIDTFVAERARALSGDSHGLSGAQLSGKRVAVGPLEHRALRCTAPGVFLIGDAAHFLDPFTGQGVCMALQGAALAAREIARMLRDGAEDAAAARFESALGALIRRRKTLAHAAGTLVRMPALAPCARLFTPLLGAIAG